MGKKKIKTGILKAEPIRRSYTARAGINFPDSGVLDDYIKHSVKKYIKKYMKKEGKSLEKEIVSEVEAMLNEHHTAVENNLRESFQTLANNFTTEITQKMLSSKMNMTTENNHEISHSDYEDKAEDFHKVKKYENFESKDEENNKPGLKGK